MNNVAIGTKVLNDVGRKYLPITTIIVPSVIFTYGRQ